jgi:SAM-dependent methyltransferase
MWDSWKLPDFVRTRYQISFDRDGHAYGDLRKILDTRQAAIRVARKAHSHFRLNPLPSPILRWLDIGCQTGTNTGEIHQWLTHQGYKLSLAAIDTSIQEQADLHQVLRYSAFLNEPRWSFEYFCKVIPASVKFDLITCLHSWYVIDPIYLVEAYRRLSERGILLLVSSPYGADHEANAPHFCGNFVNAITGAVDELLAKTFEWQVDLDQYEEKSVTEDPHRTYAEDIDAACVFFFGKEGTDFRRETHPYWIDANLILTDDGITPVGKQIVEFFLHGIQGIDKNLLYTTVRRRVASLVNKGKLPTCEWDFTIDRSGISKRRRNELCFSPPLAHRAG